MLRRVADMTRHQDWPELPDTFLDKPRDSSAPTRYQVIRDTRLTFPGVTLRLTPYDSIISHMTSGTRGRIVLETARVTQTQTVTRITHTGVRILAVIETDPGAWDVITDQTTWVKLDEPVTIQEIGLGGKSITEYLEHIAWQREAHRPGMGGRLGQRDSYSRVHHPAPGSRRPTPGGIWTGE